MKTCNLCAATLPVGSYYRDKSRSDGLSNRCKECDNAKRAKHISENKDHRRSVLKSWREANRESQAIYKQSYNKAYKEKVRAEHGVGPSSVFKRKFKAENGFHYHGYTSDWIAPKVRNEIYERDSWICHICVEPVDLDAHWNDNLYPSLDHIIPRSRGGSDNPENLKTCHRICNSIRQDSLLPS